MDLLYEKWLLTRVLLTMFVTVTDFVLSFPTGCLGLRSGIKMCQVLRIFLLIFIKPCQTKKRSEGLSHETILISNIRRTTILGVSV